MVSFMSLDNKYSFWFKLKNHKKMLIKSLEIILKMIQPSPNFFQ